ncbi:BadF/BadG/BcrA/BcrD ATPase family protein [Pseudotabrizicola algicola]|uniref:ATPase n=1 Tax=Pseudotabrizicola algicola TaxID=2709381 RepID=A0A6B3RK93_9RHOB|nr:BadF/BadG/BcrA/BcrD ATPase family protein [Pseudotabrizicola algicola]NEX46450.1 ATPase [Pseudotabrizicola algicola]
MQLFLGIDGGGTGCRAVVADQDGFILGRGFGGPANIASAPDAARDSILAATHAAMSAALGAKPSAQDLSSLRAGLGVAGANAAGAAGRLRLALPFARARIETDAVAAALGALAGSDGIVAAMGTGSVFAVRQGDKIRCFGGWGLVLGDEGSGAWLGRAALSRALRATDGLEGMTPFLAQLLQDHGGAAGIVSFAQSALPTDFAALAPSIVQSDDPAAQAIWAQATADVATVLSHLVALAPLPVTFIGGLGSSYAAALTQFAQVAPKGSALDGALLLAREAG